MFYDADAADSVVATLKIDKTHTLGVASLNSNLAKSKTNCHTAHVDNHEVVSISNTLDGNKLTSLVGYVECLDTFTATFGYSVFSKI